MDAPGLLQEQGQPQAVEDHAGLLALLAFACHASPGSIGEMMSLPFQQTARYLLLYRLIGVCLIADGI